MGNKRDIQQVNAITQKFGMSLMIGEVCSQVSFSYGDELTLDFGELTPYNHPRLADLLKGSWQLTTRATPWSLKQNENRLVTPSALDTEKAITQAKNLVKQLENQKLMDLTIEEESICLSLTFDVGFQVTLEPDLSDNSGLAYWELLMPTEQILTVGPGYFWSCKSINELS
ncbi:MAG: hypothetical protein ACKN9E_07780 [Microcystaceae cyanobacterium]